MRSAAIAKEKENKAAHEAQNNATVEMARESLVRSQSHEERSYCSQRA